MSSADTLIIVLSASDACVCVCVYVQACVYNESIFYIRPRARAYFLYDRNGSRSLMFLLSPDRARYTERITSHKTGKVIEVNKVVPSL